MSQTENKDQIEGVKSMTLSAASQKGFLYFTEDGGDSFMNIKDYLPGGTLEEELSELTSKKNVFYIVSTDPVYYQVSGETVKDYMESMAGDPGDFYDEDGDLMGAVEDAFKENPEPFEKLAEFLNSHFKKNKFYFPTSIRVDFNDGGTF